MRIHPAATALLLGIALLTAPACTGSSQHADAAVARQASAPPPPVAPPTPPAAPAAPGAAHQQVESLLREMAAAVNNADQDRFLACVLQSDPIFAMEQRNWAKDLGRKRPEKFEARLADEESDLTPGADGAVAAKVTMVWQMPDQRERTLTIPCRFVRASKGYLFAGEDWHVMEAPGVRVYFFEGAEGPAKAVADVLPDVRKHTEKLFELGNDTNLTQRVQEVKLYLSMKHLQESIYLSYTDGLSGWNEPGESIKVLAGRRGNPGMMRVLLGHEYGHVATFELGPQANDMPWWILEGVAELSAEHYSKDGKHVDLTVRNWAENDKLVPWDKLADFRGEALKHQDHVYTQGHHMVSYITERFGDTKRNDWMRTMANGASMEDATKQVLGLTFAQLDAQWRDSLTAPKEEPSKAP
jgi:Peptidase MA superfamily